MFKTKNLPKTFCTEILLLFLVAAACGNNRRPGLSDKDLFAQRKVETVQETEQVPDFSDMETYVVPHGIKYNESRAIDPAHPPVVINITNRNLNIRKFNLSDYYTKVRYIKLKHPVSTTEGNFFLTDDKLSRSLMMSRDRRLGNFEDWLTQLKFTDDFIIVGDAWLGLHCFDKMGRFLYTIESNDFPVGDNAKVYPNFIVFIPSDLKGFYGKITTNGNNCFYKVMVDNKSLLCLFDLTQEERIMTRPFEGDNLILDNKSMIDYVYEPVRATKDFLFTFDLKGDTLCRFPNYNPIPAITGGSYSTPPLPDVYYHNKQLTIRQSLNDTVYRVVSSNRLVPAYVLNFGAHGVDVPTFFRGNLSEKLFPNTWKEADQYILFVYNQNRDTPNNRKDGSVQFFYSFYDKKNRQFFHFSEGISIPFDQFFMENSIPDALPFMLSHADIEDNQLRVFYSKKRLEEIRKSKVFASLSPDRQDKLKTLQNDLDDNEVLIMILE